MDVAPKQENQLQKIKPMKDLKFITFVISGFLLLSFAFSCSNDESESGMPPSDSPAILDFSPSSGEPGTFVTITCWVTDPSIEIFFNGTKAQIASYDIISGDTSTITVLVPSGAMTGKISLVQPDKSINSNTGFIVLEKQGPIEYKKTEITDFSFTKSKNPQLTEDIHATKIYNSVGTLSSIYVIVPDGTDLTNLVSTVAFNGQKITYTQDASLIGNEFADSYPADGKAIDYKYPKKFFVSIKNSLAHPTNDLEFRTYKVFVDIENPVRFVTNPFVTQDILKGQPKGIIKTTVTNQGNNPLSIVKTAYKDKEPDLAQNVLQANVIVPFGGLKPGQTTDVYIYVSENWPSRIYKSTAVFTLQIDDYSESNGLYKPGELIIESKIVE